LPVEGNASLKKWAMHREDERGGVAVTFGVEFRECERLLTGMTGAMRNASNMDASGLHTDQWNRQKGPEVDEHGSRLTATTAELWEREDAALHETTVTSNGEKERRRVDPGEPGSFPVQDFGVLVPRLRSRSWAESEQFSNLFLDVHRGRPTYRCSAAAASGNQKVVRSEAPVVRFHGRRPDSPARQEARPSAAARARAGHEPPR
jgi:hypothetical protein